MFFTRQEKEKTLVSRTNSEDPLSSYSAHAFHLDELEWPSVEHYYQAMKFEAPDLVESIRQAKSPTEAASLAKKNKRHIRKEWKKRKQTVMTRAVYIKCRTHPEVSEALLKTGDTMIVENSQFDYYWGCGRDGRGDNVYGKVLMDVREKVRSEQVSGG
jgi:ribA/ribD-fused uncharacterized protein